MSFGFFRLLTPDPHVYAPEKIYQTDNTLYLQPHANVLDRWIGSPEKNTAIDRTLHRMLENAVLTTFGQGLISGAESVINAASNINIVLTNNPKLRHGVLNYLTIGMVSEHMRMCRISYAAYLEENGPDGGLLKRAAHIVPLKRPGSEDDEFSGGDFIQLYLGKRTFKRDGDIEVRNLLAELRDYNTAASEPYDGSYGSANY